jgi:hypothetical protein
VLVILPYAEWVHWTQDLMHCMANVIRDGNNAMRPTNSGDKKLFQHQNRTTAPAVIAACLEEGNANYVALCRFMYVLFYDIICRFMYITIYVVLCHFMVTIGIHEHLAESNSPPPWIFTKKQCIAADDCMRYVIGSCTYEERPQGVMKAGKADNSHDTIFWASTYAKWCFRSKGGPVYTENLLEIFDIMSALNATRMNVRDVKDKLRPRLIKALIRRSGLLPPTESMLTLHELIHICDQVEEVGVPRVSSLYKFKRMNHILKQLLQNKGKGKTLRFSMLFYVHFGYVQIMTSMLFYVHSSLVGLPSIMKNFAEHKKITMQMCLSMDNVDKIKSMSSFQPDNLSVRNMDLLLKPIFVDNEPEPGNLEAPPIIYSITSSGIMELHGEMFPHDLSFSLFDQLLLSAAEDVTDEECLLYMLFKKYLEMKRLHPRRNLVFITLIRDQLIENTADIVERRENDKAFMDDVAELQALITEVIEENRYCVRCVRQFMYIYVILCLLSCMSFYVLLCLLSRMTFYVFLCFYVYICHSISKLSCMPYGLCHLVFTRRQTSKASK